MKKAYYKDIIETIKKGRKRFISFMLITLLGVAMFNGIRAACVDLRYSADDFLDEQNLFDISIVSTMGLTGEDIQVLESLEGVKVVEGSYSETVHVINGDKTQNAEIKVLTTEGINMPYILDGRLPETVSEIAVTEKYITETGKKIGDILKIEEQLEEDEDASFVLEEYIITGVVIDPTDINSATGAISFRAASTTDYTFFVTDGAVNADVYTIAYITLDNSMELLSYSKEYEALIDEMMDVVDKNVKGEREQVRYDEITGEAYEEIAEAESEMESELASAWAEIESAQTEIDDGWAEIESAQIEIDDGWVEIESAQAEIDNGWVEIESAQAEIDNGWVEIESAQADINDGWIEIESAQAEINDGIAELESAQAEIDNGRSELESAQVELNSGRAELESAQAEINNGWAEINAAQAEIDSGLAELNAGQAEIDSGMAQLESAQADIDSARAVLETALAQINEQEKYITEDMTEAWAQLMAAKAEVQANITVLDMSQAEIDANRVSLEAVQAEINAGRTVLEAGQAEIDANRAVLEAGQMEIDTNMASLNAGQAEIDANKAALDSAQAEIDSNRTTLNEAQAELNAGIEDLNTGQAELDASIEELYEGQAELDANVEDLYEGQAELDSSIEDLYEGQAELEANIEDIKEGEEELLDSIAELESEESDARDEIADAKSDVADIEFPVWYIQNRESLSGYSNVKSDADCIESIGTAFPIIFLIVAVLISLTTITRMVEEDRGLIGTYKALGFKDSEIRRKYVIYAFAACMVGGILGDIFGFIVLPWIIFIIFGVMYQIPEYFFTFDIMYGMAGVLLFIVAVVGSTIISCGAELKNMPAALMRPKAPRSGSRVFLEYIKPVWRRMSFLNKVTARNLFRYKKRLLMTVFGIAGCTGLLICGFGIKDTVEALMPLQYDYVYKYHMMTIADDQEKLISYVEEDENIEAYMSIYVESIKLINQDGKEDKAQLIVVEDITEYEKYINLEDIEGNSLVPTDGNVYITENLSEVLGFVAGDSVTLQNMTFARNSVLASHIVKNYLGNNVYMTKNTYEKLFGEYKANGILAVLSENCEDQVAYSEALGRMDGVLSSVSVQDMKNHFEPAFMIINMVVYVVIVMAAILAFTVLFTLATTNISERERELATIKVLGFFDREVHSYVNKETIILTGFGILLGLPLGYVLTDWLMSILKLSSINFVTTVATKSYFYSAGLSFVFAIMVNYITNRSLNEINPVEALKSIE